MGRTDRTAWIAKMHARVLRLLSLLALTVVVACSSRVGSNEQVATVQSALSTYSHVQSASGTTTTVTFANAVNAGDLLVLVARGATAVSDNKNGAWTAGPANGAVGLWYFTSGSVAAAAGTMVVTATGASRMVADEFSGGSSWNVVTTTPNNAAPTIGTTATTILTTTTSIGGGAIVYAGGGLGTSAINWTAGTTNGVAMTLGGTVNTNGSAFGEYALASASGTQNPTISSTPAAGGTSCAVAVFEAGMTFSPNPSVAGKGMMMNPVTISGGSIPYTCALTPSPGPSGGTTAACSVTGSTVNYTAGGTAGTDTITITDGNGKTGTFTVVVETGLSFSPTAAYAPAGGALVNNVTVSGGNSPYTCTVAANNSGSAAGACMVSGTTVSYTAGGTAATDTLRITDTNGLSNTFTVGVEKLTFSPSPSVAAKGGPMTAVTISGGTAPYTSPCTVTANNSGSAAGACTITGSTVSYTAGGTAATDTLKVTDAHGVTGTFTVVVETGLTFSPAAYAPAGGPLVNNVTITGGASPYTCAVSTNNSTSTGGCSVSGSTVSYTAGPNAGTDTLKISDTNGLSKTFTVLVEKLTFSPAAHAPAGGAMNAVTIAGGTAPYTSPCTVTVNNSGSAAGACTITGSTVSYVAGTTGGTDTLQVTDADGVSNTFTVLVEKLTFSPNPSSSGTSSAMTPVTISGGSGTYPTCTVTVNNSGSAAGACTITGSTVNYTAGTTVGTDTLQITDSNGMMGTFTVVVEAGLTFSPNPSWAVASGAMAPVTITGGTAPYTCALTPSPGPSGGTSASCAVMGNSVSYTAGPSAGTDTIKITDTNGLTGTFTVAVESGFTFSPNPSSAVESAAMTPVTVTGGSGTYTTCTVQTNNSGSAAGACTIAGSTVNYTAGPAVGTDLLQIKDSNGSTGTFTVVVGPTLAFSPSPSSAATSSAMTQVTISGGSGTYSTCTVTAHPSGGTTCSISGGNKVNYTAGATGATDTIQVTDSTGHTGTFNVIVYVGSLTVTASSYAIATGSLGAAVTATTGTAPYSCFVSTNTSNAPTCSISNAGVVTYTAGATAGYNVESERSADYLMLNGTLIVTGGVVGSTAELWKLIPSGAGFLFQSAGHASPVGSLNYAYNNASTLVASQTASGASVVNLNNCGVGALYNRFGLQTGTYWQAQNGASPPYDVQLQNNVCTTAGPTQWQAFYLVPGIDKLVVTDSAHHLGTVSVSVENPVSVLPSAIATQPSTAIPTAQAWGGSGVFTGGPAGCVVTTHPSGGTMCTVTGAGLVNYIPGATSGVTDVLTITDSQGHTGTVQIAVGGAAEAVGPGTNSVVNVAPKQTAILSGATGYTIVNNNSGGSITSSGQYVAGATGNVADLVQFTASNGSTGTVIIEVGPGISVRPPWANVKPGGTIDFVASGGTDYSFALSTNASGGSVTSPGGVYTAGATPGTDVLKVTDTVGNQDLVNITVLCGSDSSLQILYPYNNTVFPLAMPPPVIQWQDNGSAQYAEVSLLYPATGTPIFSWTEIVPENGPLPAPYNLLPSALPVTGGGRAQIPAIVWTTFQNSITQNASAVGSGLVTVKTLESNQSTLPVAITVTFAPGQLKGTVYYQTYDTNLVTHGAGNPVGAVLGVNVGAATPTLVDPASTSGATCRACHSLSAGGTAMVVNDCIGGVPCTTAGGTSSDGLYGGGDLVTLPAGTESAISPGLSTGATLKIPNDGRFTWPALSPDGTMIFTSEGSQPTWMSGEWYANNVAQLPSGLYSVSTGTAITTTGVPFGLQAKFPAFATDTSAVAFNYASGALTGVDGGGTGATGAGIGDNVSLAMMSFSAATKAFSSPNVLFTPPAAPSGYPANSYAAEWPSFMPAGQNGIVFENRVAYNCNEPGGDAAACSNNIGHPSANELQHNVGSLGELWWVNTSGTPIPVKLANANGTGYAPLGPNGHGIALSTVGTSGGTPNITCTGVNLLGSAPFAGVAAPACAASTPNDSAGGIPSSQQLCNAMAGSGQGSMCTLNMGQCEAQVWTAVGNGDDTVMNFKPSVNPQTAGGYQWVVFASRRMYGNIATINPWASNPRTTAEIQNSVAQPYPETKKLWVAAMNTNPTPGSDPSYPAFYLEGQELSAGNSRGDWVLPQCITGSATLSAATACTTSADCCNAGTGAGQTQCVLDIPIVTNPPLEHCVPNSSIACSNNGGACNVDSDCCNFPSARCASGVCQVPPTTGNAYPASASVSYDFYGNCSGASSANVVVGDTSTGTSPVWEFIDTTQTVPAGTSITISEQTATTEGGFVSATMPPPTPVYTLTGTVPDSGIPAYSTGPNTVDYSFRQLAPPQASQLWLRVTVTLNASSDGMSAPTLLSLTPTFDCNASE